MIYKIRRKMSQSIDASDEMNFLGNYENLYESNNNSIEDENVMLQERNQMKLPDLMVKYVKIFEKSKCDVGKIKMEPPKIY